MHYFLQGERGIGKSFLLQQKLQAYQPYLAGFCVSRLVNQGSTAGYCIHNVKNGLPPLSAPDHEEAENCFIKKGKRDVSVLERMIIQVEKDVKKEWCRLVLLDEIGGIELTSPVFMQTLTRILNSQKPCIGVWKSQANLKNTMLHQQLEETYLALHQQMQDQLRKTGKLSVLTKETAALCSRQIDDYLAAQVGQPEKNQKE